MRGGSGEGLVWERAGQDWPNCEASRFVEAAGLTWHVQEMGEGPALVLVHGTGAATHSWRDLAPLLARDFRVVAMDLPGHGFTTMPGRDGFSLPGMARALAALLGEIAVEPALVAGHSAGAAVLARMALDQAIRPTVLLSLNGAFLPFKGLPGKVLAPVARLMANNAVIPRLFAHRARDPKVLARLVANTGSTLDARGVALYGRLAADPRHVAGALGMMAAWDLAPLVRDLPRLGPLLVLLAGASDRTVPPANAARVARLVPESRLVRLAGLGHLAHEEAPERIAELIRGQAEDAGLLG